MHCCSQLVHYPEALQAANMTFAPSADHPAGLCSARRCCSGGDTLYLGEHKRVLGLDGVTVVARKLGKIRCAGQRA